MYLKKKKNDRFFVLWILLLTIKTIEETFFYTLDVDLHISCKNLYRFYKKNIQKIYVTLKISSAGKLKYFYIDTLFCIAPLPSLLKL